MNELLNTLTDTAGNQIVRLLMALAVLVAGWLVALLIAAIVRAILKRTEIDNRLAAWVLGGGQRTRR